MLDDIVLATDALLMPQSAPYGRAINGVSFQSDNFVTHGQFQYAPWYRAVGNFTEDIMLAQRNLDTGVIKIMDTGHDLVNGDSSGAEGSSSWDAHNVISLGISTGDQKIHLSYDHHGSQLNYTPSLAMGALVGRWEPFILTSERNSLNVGGSPLNGITYPRYINTPDGGLKMTYRTGGSGNGDLWLASYDAVSGLWDSPQRIITGTNGLSYTDLVNTSTSRNAYLNGVSYDPSGNLHVTWTWRESAGGSNHDINYAYSDDGGLNWRNGAGTLIGGPLAGGALIDLNSPGIIIDDGHAGNGLLGQLDRSNTLMNQQAQTVDNDGRVHVVMWHKRDGEPPQLSPPFTTAPAAYYHYFRDPTSGDWTRKELPMSREVGSRPDLAYDALGNVYVSYLSPGPGDGQGVLDYYTEGDLIIAGATKAGGYDDWQILHADTREFATEPFIDQNRLLQDKVLSVFVQEHDDFDTGRTGTPLHLLEYQTNFALRWVGDDVGTWGTAGGTDWDTTGDATGNAHFYDGYDVVFDDSAAAFNIELTSPVEVGHALFTSSAENVYTITSTSSHGIAGSASITNNARVVLDNNASNFDGFVHVEDGRLTILGDASLGASIHVNQSALLDMTGRTDQTLHLQSESLTVQGSVFGNVNANGITAQVFLQPGAILLGNLQLSSGALFQGAGTISNVLVESGAAFQIEAPSAASVLANTFTLAENAVLALGIAEPETSDFLSVIGDLSVAGELQIKLQPEATAPMLGAMYDLFDFGSASGEFSSYDLPVLDEGLAWKVSDLLTTGELSVVADVDLDDDSDVDGHDLLLIQQQNPALLAAWQELFGATLVVPSVAALAVPEPHGLLLALLTVMLYPRRLSPRTTSR